MSEQPLDPSLAALEATLASLSPRPDCLQRDRLLFEAGKRAVPRARLWLTPAACLASAALAFGATVLLRPAPAGIERFVLVEPKPKAAVRPAEAPRAERVAQAEPAVETDQAWPAWATRDTAMSVRDQVLRWGVDALPDLPASPPRIAAKQEEPRLMEAPERRSPLEIWFSPGGNP